MAKGFGGGFGGMPGNMNQLMKQAQKMQKEMEAQQEALKTMEFEASAGGGAVSVTVNGSKVVTKVAIDPDCVDPDDVEMLQDLILAATNEAMNKADTETQNRLSGITGGMGNFGGLM